ncbi:MAG: tartrate dehydrogenase [Chloroflexi bacterium]|nr:tartrate dehydrogenase [Chloroflexota bacterium]
MAEYNLAVIPGDGVGPEVIAEGRRVLEAIAASDAGLNFTYTQFPWGSDYYRETGLLMPEDGLQQLRAFDAILFGAVGDPNIPDHITLNGLLLPMRRYFDQGVCIRPSYLYPGVKSPLEGKKAGEIDLVIIRENTEGEYAPVGGRLYPGTPHEIVIQSNVFTRRGTERIIRAAFEYCVRRNKRNKVTSVTKSNAQAFGMVFWDEVFQEVAEEYPQIETESLLVDRACMDLVRWPEAFDVMVASNLFADILSDIAAVVTGSMGLAPSANINPEREYPSMFEPVHGAAFDITGKGIANPLATISAVAMMLDHLGEPDAAKRVDGAVSQCLNQRRVLTPDIGGSATTTQVGDEVLRLLGEGGPLTAEGPERALSRLRAKFDVVPDDVSLVDELIEERRQQARKEGGE